MQQSTNTILNPISIFNSNIPIVQLKLKDKFQTTHNKKMQLRQISIDH